MLRIRDIRKQRGLTMKELGQKIGVTESAIGMYETEKRKPNYQVLLQIAEVLDTTVLDLLGAEQPKEGEHLTEEESQLIQLFRAVPEEDRTLVLVMIESALKSKGLL